MPDAASRRVVLQLHVEVLSAWSADVAAAASVINHRLHHVPPLLPHKHRRAFANCVRQVWPRRGRLLRGGRRLRRGRRRGSDSSQLLPRDSGRRRRSCRRLRHLRRRLAQPIRLLLHGTRGRRGRRDRRWRQRGIICRVDRNVLSREDNSRRGHGHVVCAACGLRLRLGRRRRRWRRGLAQHLEWSARQQWP